MTASNDILRVLKIISPNVRMAKPTAMQLFAAVLGVYFIVSAGAVYDMINMPPSVGYARDQKGNVKPVAIMPYRINGQYIVEGLAAGFMFTLGGVGFILLDVTASENIKSLRRMMLSVVGIVCVIIAFMVTRLFMHIKIPGYLYV